MLIAPRDGDIVIEYHPHSRKGTCILSEKEFKESLNHHSDPTGPLDGEPWHPFSSREDFEFAELVHAAKLSQPLVEKMIGLIQRCQEAPGSFTINSFKDLKRVSERADKLLTEVPTFRPSLFSGLTTVQSR
jgi:hypothetical protein